MASFIQDKNSKFWSVCFRIIENNREVNKRLSGFKQKKEANAAYVEFMSTHIAPPTPNMNYDLTVAQVFKEFLEFLKPRINESSLYDVDIRYNTHTSPPLAM